MIIHYLFNLLCFQFKVMTIPYFMDECQEWELNDIIDNLPYLDRNLWEIGRLNAFVTAQVNTKKKLKLEDICKFKWEEIKADEMEISKKDINRLKAKANEYLHNRTI